MEPPLTAGTVDGSLKLRGTVAQPNLDVDLEGHSSRAGKVDKIELFAELDYANRKRP